jgi:hypothetical protein
MVVERLVFAWDREAPAEASGCIID